MINKFLYGKNYKVVDLITKEDEIVIEILSKKKTGVCPVCGMKSNVIHGSYERTVQDTPLHNTRTMLHITCNEFKCKTPNCNKKTFTEDIEFVKKNKVMTDMLVQLILSLCIFMSSSTTSLILSLIGVKVSPDTVDNILKKIEIIDNPDVTDIGIDDVAIRKGRTYATAIYDMKDHRLLALLEGRKKEDITGWLKSHNKIKNVTRDRASAYAQGISEILPNCNQVADRFHLFENIIKYLKDYFYDNIQDKIYIQDGKIIDNKPTYYSYDISKIDNDILDSFSYDNNDITDFNGNVIIYNKKVRNTNSKLSIQQEKNRYIKKEKYLKIKEMIESGEKFKNIKANLGLTLPTIKKINNMSIEDINNIEKINFYKEKENKMTPYVNIILKMLIDDIEHNYIMAYIIKKGYCHNQLYLSNYITLLAINNNLKCSEKFKCFIKQSIDPSVIEITRNELFIYLMTIDEKKLDKKITENLSILIDKYPIITEVSVAFKEFHTTIFSKDENKLDEYIFKYKDHKKLKTFCKGLKKDIAAIKQAISSNLSSGFVEGNNNKFKLIKRIVYGKQKICNLFKRCYLSFTVKLDDDTFKNIVESVINQ